MSTLKVSNIQNGSATNIAMVLDTAGTVKAYSTISVGNVTPSSSGAGITFPATASASSNANTLDDYEEGTWTPTDASGASLSFTVVSADYVKIGKSVTVNTYFVWPSTANGNAAAWNLPFTKNGYSGTTILTNLGSQVSLYFPDGSTTVYLRTNNNSDITNATFSGKYIFATFTYFV